MTNNLTDMIFDDSLYLSHAPRKTCNKCDFVILNASM